MQHYSHARPWDRAYGIAAIMFAAAIGPGATADGFPVEGSRQSTIVYADLGLVYSTDNPIIDQRRIDVEDSTVVLVLWDELTPAGSLVPHFAISLDGRNVSRVRTTSYDLMLRYQTFEPRAGAALVPGELVNPDSNVYIVQFETQPLDVFRRRLEALGAEIQAFLANHAYVVHMTPDVKAAVESLAYVRWVGPFHPAYRLEEALVDGLTQPGALLEDQRYNIQVARRGLDQKLAVADRIATLGGVIEHLVPDGFLLSATLTADALLEIAAMDEVMFIDRWMPPQVFMNNVREDGGANHVETVAGYTGAGVRAEVMDLGLLVSHQAFQAIPPIVRDNFPNPFHGTSVYGINFGDGTGGQRGRGLIPDAQGIFASFMNLTDRYQHTADLVNQFHAVYQTNSWGQCCTTQYGSDAREMDDITFINDILILQAQANNGNQVSSGHAWAKNIVSVGGVRHFNTLPREDDRWDQAGSIGPAADGRIKPDLCYWYDRIRTTNEDGGYRNFGGTSAATPTAAGHFGLMYQMWSDGIFGNPVDPNGTVFENRPHMSTAKAIMINTVEPYDFVGENHDLTRMHQGWGPPSVRNLYELRDSMFIVDETDVLSELSSTVYELEVEAGTPALRATLVFTDLPGTTSSAQHRINDLTLMVTSPSGTVYWGNNGLLAGNWSSPGGFANSIDTTENVWIQNPEAGLWHFEVRADEINADAHVETDEVDADYALVVSGVLVGCGFESADVNCDGIIDAFDIEPLIGLLFGGPKPCSSCAGDVNGDGTVDAFDIEPFIDCLFGGVCP